LTCEWENGGERHHGQLEGEGGQAGQLSGEAQLLHIENFSFLNVRCTVKNYQIFTENVELKSNNVVYQENCRKKFTVLGIYI
jgi:hypothetical protein